MHIYHCNPERVRHAGPPHGCAWACHPPCPAVRGCFTACKRDALTGAPLAGAIYGLYQSGRAVQSVVSDVWGRLPFTNLAPGGYALLELRAPEGYRPDTSEHMVTVDVSGRATVDGSPAEGYALYNQPLARLAFPKRDEGIGRPVAGAVFQLSNGQGAVSDPYGKVDFGAVPPGSHTLRETAPAEGYLPNPRTYTVTVSAEGEIRIDGEALEAFSITNRRTSPGNL